MALRTPLYAWHVANGARIVDFGGWDMPVVYTSIVKETSRDPPGGRPVRTSVTWAGCGSRAPTPSRCWIICSPIASTT